MLPEEMSRRDELLMMISDMFKDVNGFRPGSLFYNQTDAELEQTFDDLQFQLEIVIENEQEERDAATAAFEKQISELIATGANDRETAIRWLRDSFDDEQMSKDDDYFEYTMNLPSGYLKGK